MFYAASTFNQDLNGWNTSAVTNMGGMFQNASGFNGTIGNWDTSKVTNMGAMFQSAGSFNGDVSQWDVGNVEDLRRVSLARAGRGREQQGLIHELLPAAPPTQAHV